MARRAGLRPAHGSRAAWLTWASGKALQLDFLVDDRLQHCVDVASESNARAILILRRDDPTAAQGAKRLGIEVVPSVAEALDLLEREQQARVKPTLLERIARKVGWDG